VLSDKVTRLAPERLVELRMVMALNADCNRGDVVPLDLMQNEVPGCVYNTAGYLGVFNYTHRGVQRTVDLSTLAEDPDITPAGVPAVAVDVWSGERIAVQDGHLRVPDLPRHGSRLFRVSGA
jgi:hypothetical protein